MMCCKNSALDAEVEYKKRAYHTFYEVRSFVYNLPDNHPAFRTIKRQKSIKKQAEQIMSLLWLLEQQRLNPKDSPPES